MHSRLCLPRQVRGWCIRPLPGRLGNFEATGDPTRPPLTGRSFLSMGRARGGCAVVLFADAVRDGSHVISPQSTHYNSAHIPSTRFARLDESLPVSPVVSWPLAALMQPINAACSVSRLVVRTVSNRTAPCRRTNAQPTLSFDTLNDFTQRPFGVSEQCFHLGCTRDHSSRAPEAASARSRRLCRDTLWGTSGFAVLFCRLARRGS
jgi:hypothetical protein